MLWGSLLLGERIGWHTVLGSLAILAGTALVTGLSLPAWRGRARQTGRA